ncbi:hypothetical protein IID22_01355 [Patescibacteria group bacterium]|nr:hypothetical protein [Patescibacteria group bacterium]
MSTEQVSDKPPSLDARVDGAMKEATRLITTRMFGVPEDVIITISKQTPLNHRSTQNN